MRDYWTCIHVHIWLLHDICVISNILDFWTKLLCCLSVSLSNLSPHIHFHLLLNSQIHFFSLISSELTCSVFVVSVVSLSILRWTVNKILKLMNMYFLVKLTFPLFTSEIIVFYNWCLFRFTHIFTSTFSYHFILHFSPPSGIIFLPLEGI